MAPTTPPLPPKNPLRHQSSPNERVQKRPPPVVPPRPPNSRRNQAVQGTRISRSLANGPNATDNEDASSWTSRVDSESDVHTATQVDLAMLETALDESIRDNHAELKSRISSGESSPQLKQVSQHLLASPPSSPSSIHH